MASNAQSAIAQTPFFAGFSAGALEQIASVFAAVALADDEAVVSEGQTPQIFAIVTSGTLELRRQGKRYALLVAGDFFGFRNLFEDHRSSSTIVATKSATVLQINRVDFEQLLAKNPEYTLPLLRLLSTYVSDRKTADSVAGSISINSAADSSQKATICVFDSKIYQQKHFDNQNKAGAFNYDLVFLKEKLDKDTVSLARGAQAVVVFVHDKVDREVASLLKKQGIELVAYRCAGTDTCDISACDELGMSVVNVPAYSPNAVAEHAVALMMALNRKLIFASSRIHTGDFSLDGLVGFNMKDKTAGVIGTGKIGLCLVQILLGFGCNVICQDVYKNSILLANSRVRYVELDELFATSDIISLHAPLTDQTHHLINATTIKKMKRNVMIINTSRGPLIDTLALIEALKTGHIGSCGLDVVEGENEYFYEDKSEEVMQNDMIGRLLSFNTNVIITAHQAFLTTEALHEIALVTLRNIQEYRNGKRLNCLTNSINKIGSTKQT